MMSEDDDEKVLNDPELLEELNMLMSDTTTTAIYTTTNTDSLKHLKVAQENGNEIDGGNEDLEIDEHEMPDLLKELSLLTGNTETKFSDEKKLPVNKEIKPNNASIPAKAASQSVKSPAAPPAKTQSLPAAKTIASTPSVPPKATGQTTADTNKAKRSSKVEDCLQHQVDTCAKQASDLYKLGKKDEALQYHKYKKQFITDQSLLQLEQKPEFKRINVRYEKICFNWDVPLDKMVFTLTSVTGLSVDYQVKIDSPFNDQIIVSPTIRNNKDCVSPLFSHSFHLEQTKTFQRYFEKKKVSIEFQQPRFLRSPIFLGKLVISLNNLLNKSTIEGPMQIMDVSNRKPIGAFVECSLKLRKPFVKDVDSEVICEPWIITNEPEFYSLILENSSGNSTAMQPSQQSKIQEKKDAISTSLQARKSLKQSKSAENSSPQASEDVEDLIMKFDACQTSSNNVLEAELASLMQSPRENKDKIEAVQLQMNVLIIQVQTGALTMEAYLEKLKAEVIELKKTCLTFKRAGQLPHAKRALERIKIIEAEISSASEVSE